MIILVGGQEFSGAQYFVLHNLPVNSAHAYVGHRRYRTADLAIELVIEMGGGV